MSTTECDKRTVRYDISTAQCDNEIVKCEKTIMVPPNVTKIQLEVMLVLSNVTNKTVKCEKKIGYNQK